MTKENNLQREFITTWEQDAVFTGSDPAYFFEVIAEKTGKAFVVVPSDITPSNLACFIGKRTKVTIEVIPW